MNMEDVLTRIRKFRDERDWMQIHDAKNLAVSIVIEAAELLEHFQWKNKEQVEEYTAKNRDGISEERRDCACQSMRRLSSVIFPHDDVRLTTCACAAVGRPGQL